MNNKIGKKTSDTGTILSLYGSVMLIDPNILKNISR